MKELILPLSISIVFAYDLTPYFAYVNYQNSTKDYSTVVGSYFSALFSPYKVELNGSYYYQKNRDSTSYKQTDISLILTYFKGYNLLFRGGIHNIFTSGSKDVSVPIYNSRREIIGYKTVAKTTTGYDNNFYLGMLYYKM